MRPRLAWTRSERGARTRLAIQNGCCATPSGFTTHRDTQSDFILCSFCPPLPLHSFFPSRGASRRCCRFVAPDLRTEPIRVSALHEHERAVLRPSTSLLCTVPRCFGRLAQGQQKPSRAIYSDSGSLRLSLPFSPSELRYASGPLRHSVDRFRLQADGPYAHGGFGCRLLQSAHIILCSDPRLCPSLYGKPIGGLGQHFLLLPTILGSVRLFGIGEAMWGSCYPAGCPKALLHRVECIVWHGSPNPY